MIWVVLAARFTPHRHRAQVTSGSTSQVYRSDPTECFVRIARKFSGSRRGWPPSVPRWNPKCWRGNTNSEMPTRPCLDCSRLTTRGSRCELCTRLRQQTTDTRRGSTAQRGYNAGWRRLVELAKQAQRDRHGTAYCIDCGLTEVEAKQTGNPLTGDHLIPKVRGGLDELSNIVIRCRPHNSSKGSR